MLKDKIREIGRNSINIRNRKRLKNMNPTIISSNCNGAVILHDLGLRLNTPTVNAGMSPKDYIKFLKNLGYYLSQELIEITENKDKYYLGELRGDQKGYYIAHLGDLVVFFGHYKSFEQAKCKWQERVKRVNKNNIFIMMTDRDGCTYDDIKEFDKLTYKNKVIFTNKKYEEIKSSYYIKGFEDKESVGVLIWYKNRFGKRYIDDFDYVRWLNGDC